MVVIYRLIHNHRIEEQPPQHYKTLISDKDDYGPAYFWNITNLDLVGFRWAVILRPIVTGLYFAAVLQLDIGASKTKGRQDGIKITGSDDREGAAHQHNLPTCRLVRYNGEINILKNFKENTGIV